MAIDLEERFKQHNGIIPINPNACKKEKINEYFNTYDRLGYSIFVQSPLSQPITRKNKKRWGSIKVEDFPVFDLRNEADIENLRIVEGILIETYKQRHGDLPLWNRVGGLVDGQRRATSGNYQIIKSFIEPSVLTAKSTLREIASSPTIERYENYLFAVRFYMLYLGYSYDQALDTTERNDILGTYKEMARKGYINKELQI